MKKKKDRSSFLWSNSGLLLVIIVSCIPLLNLLTPGLPVTHDGQDHVARIANFYASLSEGNIIPRWAMNLNWGYGHPVLMFLYPFSSYLASFFHLVGFSFVDSLKIIFALGYVASGIAMYLWAKEQFNENAAIVASVLYLFAPYRFIDLYVRGAIGEHIAFIFPPLILYFILKFFKEKKIRDEYKYLIGLSISFALLLLAHNAISLIFLPLIITYSIICALSFGKFKKLVYVSIAFLFGLFLSAFFTIPAFLEGKFTLRDIVTKGEYKSRFVDPLALIYGPWNYGGSGTFSVQLGILNLTSLILLPFTFLRLKKNGLLKNLLITTFIYFIFTIFVMLRQSDFLYEIFTILQKFQFPWRFLSFTVFALPLFGAAFIFALKNKLLIKISLAVVILGSILLTNSYWKAKEYSMKPESFYSSVYLSTTDTGESAPIWSVRFMEKVPSAQIETISGIATIEEKFRNSTTHTYKIKVESDNARMKDNTVYFPSWKVFVDNVEVPIQFQDPTYRGLITFELNKGEHNVDVVFKDTKLRMLSNIISIISAFILLGLVFYLKKNEQ